VLNGAFASSTALKSRSLYLARVYNNHYTRPPTAALFLKRSLPHKCFHLRKAFPRMLAAGEFGVRIEE